MHNFAVRLLLFVIGLLIVFSIIWNFWIGHQVSTEDSVQVDLPMTGQTSPEIQGEVSTSYEEENTADEAFTGWRPEKNAVYPQPKVKQERIRDEKIIYEMPTSNRFLIQ